MFGIDLNWYIIGFGVLIGFSVGILTALFGAGGGFIITPALNIFMGLPMNLAVGTSACQVTGASAFALYEHLDRRLLGIRVAMFFGIGIPLGAYFGATQVQHLKGLADWNFNGREIDPVNIVLLIIFAVLLLLIAAWMLYDSFIMKKQVDVTDHPAVLSRLRIPPLFRFRTIHGGDFSIPVMIMLGLIVGFFSGMLGIGGGVIIIPILFYLVGQETKAATQTSMMLVFSAGLFSSGFHAYNGNIDYILAGALLFGALFGAKIGARIHRKISGEGLKKSFGFVVLAAWVMVIVKIGIMLWG
ncbi:MAG: sulfite exporter TauE/SafE family protein [Victivallales bacterium]|nr:sulfite exporter TauE/SafE family protein [Victivallales bacterium]